jgi:NADPH:quinone reductase-like Zn-dependent oxidoreductase
MTLPTRMRAAYVTAYGPAETIAVGELPVPAVGPADVLVAVQVVSVNPVDTFVRSGRYATPVPFPFILGRDLAGQAVSVGAGVSSFAPGDRVWCNSLGHEGRQGSFAEFAAVPADRLYRIPDGVTPEVAVAVAHPAATAYLAWFAHGMLRLGETVYVGGAAGNVGTAAVTMAHAAGARVLASARPADFQRCRPGRRHRALTSSGIPRAARISAWPPRCSGPVAGLWSLPGSAAKHRCRLAPCTPRTSACWAS